MLDATTPHDDDQAGPAGRRGVGVLTFAKDALVLFSQADQLAAMIVARRRRDFSAWALVGKALVTAKAQIAAHHGGSLSHPGRPWSNWLDQHPGLRAISESDRSSASWMWTHYQPVLEWRETLPPDVRESLTHPHSNRLAYQRYLRMMTTAPKQKPPPKSDLRCHVTRIEKALCDLVARHSALEIEVVDLRGRVASLEAIVGGPASRHPKVNGHRADATHAA